MNLVLIGYRGTGKSTVAGILAKMLGMTAVSLDEEITREAGLSIPEIVERHGWGWFRDLESEVVRRFSLQTNLIIDAGGGAILKERNVKNLRAGGCLFWLKASQQVIVDRIQQSTDRPSLTPGRNFLEEVTEVLEQRVPLYRGAADHQIDTDELSPKDVAGAIAQIWHERTSGRCARPSKSRPS